MSRRYSPRTLNTRTDTSDLEQFELSYDHDAAWSSALDESDSLLDDMDAEDIEDEDYLELTETEYDNDWDSYWKERRDRRSQH